MNELTAPSPLRELNRHITDHNEEGKAVFSTTIPPSAQWTAAGEFAKFFLGYCTKTFPVRLSSTADIDTYADFLSSPPGLSVSGGTVLRIVDMAPGQSSPMHRTVSLDYGVVLEGEVELILDGGETRLMKRGDTAIQRGTNHAWRNTSETEWSRMLYVLVDGVSSGVAGKVLGEDLGGMDFLRKSD